MQLPISTALGSLTVFGTLGYAHSNMECIALGGPIALIHVCHKQFLLQSQTCCKISKCSLHCPKAEPETLSPMCPKPQPKKCGKSGSSPVSMHHVVCRAPSARSPFTFPELTQPLVSLNFQHREHRVQGLGYNFKSSLKPYTFNPEILDPGSNTS